jgi:hypothetical protein
MKLKYHYIIDTKLLFYSCQQRGQDPLETFNSMADILYDTHKKGHVYLVADIGKSSYRLAISKYYKGKRREDRAKQTEEERLKYSKFSEEYVAFVELCKKKLPVTVIDVHDVEADDTASILSFRLAKDKNNRIGLITRDKDWLHSVIESPNVKIISPYYTEDDMRCSWAKDCYNVRSREEFTLKKTLEGDSGDSILHPKWLGTQKTDLIWERCLKHKEVTFDILKEETLAWIAEQPNPEKFTVPEKYIEYNVASTLEEVLEVNYKLAATMTDVKQLTESQQVEFEEALKRDSHISTIDPINDGISIFGRPIVFNEIAKKVFNVSS